jgi:hypothetical protein
VPTATILVTDLVGHDVTRGWQDTVLISSLAAVGTPGSWSGLRGWRQFSGDPELLVVRDGVAGGGVLHQGQHSTGHETGRPNRSPPSGQLAHLDETAPCPYVDATPRPGGHHFVCPGLSTGVDHDLYTITFHVLYNAVTCTFSPGDTLVGGEFWEEVLAQAMPGG